MSFWDSSALVRFARMNRDQFLPENYGNNFPEHFVWWETSVEICSALARLERENMLNAQKRSKAEQRINILEKIWTEIEPELRIKELARTFPATHGLKAADSLQLASALI